MGTIPGYRSRRTMTSPIQRPVNGLQTAAVIALPAGAFGSLGLMFWSGRRNPSILLMVLFTIWVLSPFVVLAVAHVSSKGWPARARIVLSIVTLVIAAGSLAMYARMWTPKRPTAFIFLVVPPVSWLLMAATIPIS